MRLVFWHPFLSIHHAPVIRQLSLMPEMKVELVAGLTLECGRSRSGWSIPDYGNTELFDNNKCTRDLIERVVGRSNADTLHLISDALSDPISRAAWQYCVRKGVPFGFISICPGTYVGSCGRMLRRALYSLYVRRAARAVNPILAISRQCSEFYLRHGFPAEHVFPWAYFVENHATIAEKPQSAKLRLLYLGRLINRKRVDYLIHALSGSFATIYSVSLTIIGDGPERGALTHLVNNLRLCENVEFKPTVSHEKVHQEMQLYDVLILPTECDDWGVVVNEALQAGLAVVTTENAGACELIEHSRAGVVCQCNPSSMRSAIEFIANSPHELMMMRARAREYSEKLSPSVAAQYLRAIAQHTLYGERRPSAPWQSNSNAETKNESAQNCLYQCGRPVDDAYRLFDADAANSLDARQ
jgi:glycosyltransferase involved in cell wall biosynthesis